MACISYFSIDEFLNSSGKVRSNEKSGKRDVEITEASDSSDEQWRCRSSYVRALGELIDLANASHVA